MFHSLYCSYVITVITSSEAEKYRPCKKHRRGKKSVKDFNGKP